MKHHPVTHGAIVASASLGTFHLTEASYEPGKVVPVHEHLRSGWTLTLEGVYNERFRKLEHFAPMGSVLGKPATARHSNRYGAKGARCFLIGVETDHPATHPGVARALREVTFHAQGPVPAIVRRMHREFVAREVAWALVLEGLILDLSAAVMRLTEGTASRFPPGWLMRVREQLHASFVDTPTFESLAQVAGVHPVHLSRAFRAAYGSTPGDYLRAVRIDHAKRLLTQPGLPIAQVAAAIGFCDQSHLTRTFRRATGMTPAAYRMRRSA
jgi:AraC family transcriptional regulator